MSADAAPTLDFLVRRDDFARTRFVEGQPPADLADGQVLFRVDCFALTANNISYAAAGDMLRYWDFFPAEEGWGRIPAMGFADVVASRHPGVAEGERCFGFYPMSRHLVIEPASASPRGIVDGAPHRRGIAPTYNSYQPALGDPGYEAAHEDAHMLMRGLFITSYLIDDFLGESDLFGAARVVISSASSKTSMALAHQLARRGGVEVAGLTSARNADFVKGLGSYGDVVLYEELESLAPDVPSVFVDMAGNGDVVNRLHRHLGEAVRYSCVVGATHWQTGGRDADLPGAKPEFFFAPAQIQKRAGEWGAEELQKRMGEAWKGFRDASASWLRVVRGRGREDLERVYRETLEGRTLPCDGHVLSLREGA